ncbi:MAG: ABC transporter permease, partial [Actinobacteria bacterium]|nr:ABC transporter permease [Actinomycetota bacterium]
TDLSLPASRWPRLLAALLAGSIPFVVLGIAITYWTSAKSALPVANLLYMLLSYAGGLWTGPNDLPRLVARISRFTPTRQWGDILWPIVAGGPSAWSHWLALLGYSALFALLAAWGYRRDDGQRFR